MPNLTTKKQWKFNQFREQRYRSLSEKYTLYRYQGVILDTQRNQIIEVPSRDFEQVHLIGKSATVALQIGNLVQLFNLRSQVIEAELSMPDRVIALTSCKEGGEMAVLCANNQLIQFVASQSGFIAGKQVVIDEQVNLYDTTEMLKLDQDLYVVLDKRGQLRFINLEDTELVKFKTSL